MKQETALSPADELELADLLHEAELALEHNDRDALHRIVENARPSLREELTGLIETYVLTEQAGRFTRELIRRHVR